MSETGIDYSKFTYKITERAFVDWDGLFFDLVFSQPLRQDQKEEVENTYNKWGKKNQEGDNSIHYFDDPTWSEDSKNLKFWADMGSTEPSVLEELLNSFSSHTDLIQELFIGRDPKPKE